MKAGLIALSLTVMTTLANGQFSCTPNVAPEICKAAEAGNVTEGIQKDLTVIITDPAAFSAEKKHLEAAAEVRCASAKTPRDVNRCSGQAAYGIASGVLLETSPDGRLQKVVVSTDHFRGVDKSKTKLTQQPDGTSKLEMASTDPDPATTFEKMTQLGYFVLGYNSGQLNYMLDNQ